MDILGIRRCVSKVWRLFDGKNKKNTTRQSKGAEAAMDWSRYLKHRKPKPRKSGVQSEYDSKYIEPSTVKDRSESEDWVIVDKKDADEPSASSDKLAFSSSYDYAFNNGWKRLAKRRSEYSATGCFSMVLANTMLISNLQRKLQQHSKRSDRKRLWKMPLETKSVWKQVVDVPAQYRTSEYKRKISAPAYKRVLKPVASKKKNNHLREFSP